MLLSKIKRNKRHAEYNRYMNHCQWEELRYEYGPKVAITLVLAEMTALTAAGIAVANMPDAEMAKVAISALFLVGLPYTVFRGHFKVTDAIVDRKLAKMNITPRHGAKSFEELEKEREEEKKQNK